MSVENLTEIPLVNIVRAEIITEEDSPKTYRFDTADEATYTAVTSEGQETIHRTKNVIHAVNRTEDIQYGSDINMKNANFIPEVLAIVDGGTLVKSVDKVTGYKPPVVGKPVKRTLFTLNIYSEEKDIDGETKRYAKFSFPSCKGKPASFTFKDGEFMTPSYTISSRTPSGKAPYDLTFLEELPE